MFYIKQWLRNKCTVDLRSSEPLFYPNSPLSLLYKHFIVETRFASKKFNLLQKFVSMINDTTDKKMIQLWKRLNL